MIVCECGELIEIPSYCYWCEFLAICPKCGVVLNIFPGDYYLDNDFEEYPIWEYETVGLSLMKNEALSKEKEL